MRVTTFTVSGMHSTSGRNSTMLGIVIGGRLQPAITVEACAGFLFQPSQIVPRNTGE
jgi:hypothetical protein